MDPSLILIAGAVAAGLVCGFIGAALLARRDQSGMGFALGFFLGPVGLIIAAILRGQPVDAEPTRRCPECAEVILAAARKCRWCGSAVADSSN